MSNFYGFIIVSNVSPMSAPSYAQYISTCFVNKLKRFDVMIFFTCCHSTLLVPFVILKCIALDPYPSMSLGN